MSDCCAEFLFQFNTFLTIRYFSCSTWESNTEPSSTQKSWNDLTEAERSAAGVLGFNKKKVSNLDTI